MMSIYILRLALNFKICYDESKNFYSPKIRENYTPKTKKTQCFLFWILASIAPGDPPRPSQTMRETRTPY